MCMSVAEEAIRKVVGRVDAPLDCWWCTNPPDNMQKGSTHTGISPTGWNQTFRSVQSSIFKSMSNATQSWEGTGVPRISKYEEGREPYQQIAPYLQSAGISQHNLGRKKVLDVYIRNFLCVK